jgi:hypothetical protein
MKAKRKKAKRLVIHGQNRFAEMDEKDAKELAKIINEKGEIYLSDYFRPIVIIRHADPEIVPFCNTRCRILLNRSWQRLLFR